LVRVPLSEDDCAFTRSEYPLFDNPSESARKHRDLDVATALDHRFGAITMVDTDDVLFDNWSVI
jgi:hypothetical protein